jgi:hypothetical protein
VLLCVCVCVWPLSPMFFFWVAFTKKNGGVPMGRGLGFKEGCVVVCLCVCVALVTYVFLLG